MKTGISMPIVAILLCVYTASLQAEKGVTAALRSQLQEEFSIDREQVFEFAKKPSLTRKGDRVTISFETKGFCDVTVAVENAEGTILRHLASGVLGPNAPKPFRRNSRAQEVVWDGKDDRGRYVAANRTDYSEVRVRVSLGLRARFERHYLWSPHRRFTARLPSFGAQPEGVYVMDGRLTGFIYQFDHQGNYIRTVYPFPSDKLDRLVGVKTRVFEQSGKKLPLKSGMLYSSLLTCGFNTNAATSEEQIHSGEANSAMTVSNGQIALAYYHVNSIATDGSSGGVSLEGPRTHLGDRKHPIPPRSIALSPDGKTAYVTGYYSVRGTGANVNTYWVHGVGKADVANGRRDDKMELFAGIFRSGRKAGGSKPGQFKVCSSVACDAQGRVYVNDHFNDRIQVFNSGGKHLKNIPVNKPTDICINPGNGHIWVFSWALDSPYFRKHKGGYGRGTPVKPSLTHLGPFKSPKVLGTYTFPLKERLLTGGRHGGTEYRGVVDFWAPKDRRPQIWLISGPGGRYRGASVYMGALQILRRKKGKKNELAVVFDFTDRAKKDGAYMSRLDRGSMQLTVNPVNGDVYIHGARLKIEPDTGKVRGVKFPQAFSDMAFDMDGHAYLSSGAAVARYAVSSSGTWREVPFDYGEQRHGRISVIPTEGGPYHTGGVSVSPKGHVIVCVMDRTAKLPNKQQEKERRQDLKKWSPWTPEIYPGRGGRLLMRVWDRYGKLVYPDVVQGIGYCHNIFMDRDDFVYVATGAVRNGYPLGNTGTLVKCRPGTRILTTSAKLPLSGRKPDRPPDTRIGGIGNAWWQGALWFYGGIGYNGKNHGGIHACHCSQFRITQDYYARTFVPETVHYTVGVLDSAGNLIMRIGRYGNVDDGVPLVPDPRISKPRSLGGDEVGLFHPAYLAVRTDKRLHINDPGNDRILSVKLGYHTSETVPLAGK